MDNKQYDIFNNDDRQVFVEYDYDKKPKKKNRLYILIAVAVVIAVAAGSFAIGFAYAKSTGLYSDMPLLAEAYSYVKQYYYQDISWEEFQSIAAKAVVDNVDKFTGMYEYDYTTGEVAIGIKISSDLYNRHTISYVSPASAAEEALAVEKYTSSSLTGGVILDTETEKVKIEIGDRIYAISILGSRPTIVEHAQSSYFAALANQSDNVTLYMQKSDGFGNYLDEYYKFNITKKYIQSKKAFYYTSEQINDATNQTAMIRLDAFTDSAAEDFLNCVNTFVAEGKTKLILDLRDNGGGDSRILGFISACLLKGADTSDLNIAFYKYNAGKGKYGESFFTSQRTYKVEDSKGNVLKEINAVNLPALIENFEVTVLCNGMSASCSEVIIGALQFYNGSEIVGSTTYGKGVAQTQIPLSDGIHYVLITNGKYFIPTFGENGETLWQESIHEVGFTPKEENKISTSSHRPFKNDLYIARAVEILTN